MKNKDRALDTLNDLVDLIKSSSYKDDYEIIEYLDESISLLRKSDRNFSPSINKIFKLIDKLNEGDKVSKTYILREVMDIIESIGKLTYHHLNNFNDDNKDLIDILRRRQKTIEDSTEMQDSQEKIKSELNIKKGILISRIHNIVTDKIYPYIDIEGYGDNLMTFITNQKGANGLNLGINIIKGINGEINVKLLLLDDTFKVVRWTYLQEITTDDEMLDILIEFILNWEENKKDIIKGIELELESLTKDTEDLRSHNEDFLKMTKRIDEALEIL